MIIASEIHAEFCPSFIVPAHFLNHTHLVAHLMWPYQPENLPGGLGLSGLAHEEAHPCVLILVKLPLKALMLEPPTACWFHLLITLLEKKILTAVPKFN